MTKYKTTEREQRANNNLIISFSYCSIQNIERFLKANAYTRGLYGWKADFYEFNGFTLSTGYSPLKWIYCKDKANLERYAYIEKEILKFEEKLKKINFLTYSKGLQMTERFFKNLEKKAIYSNFIEK
jgi:hypothetical protein